MLAISARRWVAVLCIGLLVVVVQLLALIGSVPAAGAAAVPSISLSPATVAPGGTLTVDGSGFTYSSSSSSLVTISLNAPNPSNAGSHVGTSAVFAQGDNVENPAICLSGTTCFLQNAMVVAVASSTIGAGGQLPAQTFTLPSTAAPGVYRVTAYDGGSATTAGATFTVGAVAATSSLTVSNGGVIPLGGQFNVSFSVSGNYAGDPISFDLMNFAQDPRAFGATSTPPVAGAGDYGLGAGGALTAIPLQVVPPASSNGSNCTLTSAGLQPACVAPSAGGYLDARLQLASPGSDVVSSGALFDQIYTIVAVVSSSAVKPTVLAAAGVKLDHTVSSITVVGDGIAGPSGTVLVSGSGFAANATVDFWAIDESGSGACQVQPGSHEAASATSSTPDTYATTEYVGQITPPPPSGVAAGACYLGDAATDGDGGFTDAGAVLNGNVASGAAHILAEDWAPSAATPGTGERLNEGALGSVTIGSAASSGKLVLSTSLPGGSYILDQAVVSQTVSFTATGYTPSSATASNYVHVSLTGGSCDDGTTDGTATGPLVAGHQRLVSLPTVQIDTAGTARGSFTVPSACGLQPAGSLTVDVSGTGPDGAMSQTAAFTISRPVITATVLDNGAGLALAGHGFWAGEAVNFYYRSTQSPSSAGSSLQAGTLYADGQGNLSGPAGTAPNALALPSGYYVYAGGMSSNLAPVEVVAGTSAGGVLSCPASNLVPGQVVILTGTQFAVAPQGASGSNSMAIGFAPAPLGPIAVTVDAGGNLTATFTVPPGTAPGGYTLAVTAYVAGGGSAQQQRVCNLTVVNSTPATFTSSLSAAPVGGTTVISGTDFGPGESVSVSLQYTSSGLAGMDVPGTAQVFTADSNGAIFGIFTIKSATGALIAGGRYNLAARGTTTGRVGAVPFTIAAGGPVAGASSIYFAEGYTGQTSGGAGPTSRRRCLSSTPTTTPPPIP